MFLIESSAASEPTPNQLISEKIAIPSEVPRSSRQRLLAMLKQSLTSCTSTILIGRAGSGKTSLALDFARHCGRSVAWYKVDAPDGELRIFFQYLIASIRQQRPGFGSETLMPLIQTVEPDLSMLAEAFVYELLETETNPLVVIIEDLHLVCDAEWLVPFFRRVLPLLPSAVHLLITSRSMPPAPLWRMRSKQTLSVIDEQTLAFTRQEAIELFASHGLPSEHASIALDHTRGRAAALASFASAANSDSRIAGE